MAVSDTHSHLSEGEEWVVCEISLRRGYKSCSFVAVSKDDEREEIGKSRQFRARLGSAAPPETPEAASCLAALEQELESSGWELIAEDRPAWYSMRYRRNLVPLSRRIGAYATGVEPAPVATAVAAANGTNSDSIQVDSDQAEAELLDAKRLEAERHEAERLEAERLEGERLEAERLETERLEAERLEAERLETERLVAERLEVAKLEAARIEAERLEAERLEAERQAKAEAERAAQAAQRTESLPPPAAAVQAPPETPGLSEAEQIRLGDRLGSYSFVSDHDRTIEIRAILHLANKRPVYGHEVQHEPRY